METPLPSVLMLHILEDLQYHPLNSLNLAIFLRVVRRVDLLCLMWYAFTRLLTSLFANGVPFSLISLLGIPNHVMMCSRMKFKTAALVAFFKGMASTHFVKCSMTVKIYIWPLESGFIGLMRSRPQVWKGHEVVISCSTFGWVCIASPSTWHAWHALTNSSESFFMVDQ